MSDIQKITNPIDRIEVLADGSLQVRESTRVFSDGVSDPDFSPTYHRYVLHPGADLAGKDSRIVAVANSVWTSDVLKEYQGASGGKDF